MARGRAPALALAVLAVGAGCGPGSDGRGGAPSAPSVAGGDAPLPGDGRPVRVAPRWVRVAALSGTGTQRSAAFTITEGVLQWRVTATCDTGHLRIAVPGEADALVDQACPGRAFGFSIRTGAHALEVAADGRWEAVVEEQVEKPLAEPILPGMSDRSRLAAGAFTGVEQQGGGVATLYELADGRRALRLDPFFVTPNDDLFLWVSEAPQPRTSADALFTPHVQVEALKATAGTQNYLLPESLPLDRIRSIVIWCEPVRTAYAAAPLGRR